MHVQGSDKKPTDIRLYARKTSSNCQKVLWFLGELGLDYELVPTGGDSGGLREQAFLEMNPNGKVPTLQDGRFAVWESHSILRYLAAAYSADRYWPTDPVARSRVDRWMDWSQSQFEDAFMRLFWGYWRTPADHRDVQANEGLVVLCRNYLEILDGALAGQEFLAGESMSLADIPVGAMMYRYANLGVTEGLPSNVSRWYKNLTQRPAFQDCIKVPFDELKGRLAF